MKKAWLAGGVVALVAGGVGFGLGDSREQVRFEEGVTCFSGDSQASCDLADGETVGFRTDLAWSDKSFHNHGRPACLAPPGHKSEALTLAWVPVEVDGIGWRQVVWIGC